MEKFIKYLESSKKLLNESNLALRHIHLVLGNESCDLDSTISALLYGYFLFEKRPLSADDTLVVPILNVSSTDFPLRNENCLVLKQAGIDSSILVFRDQVNIERILTEAKRLTVTLVDHHVLSKRDEVLFKNVTQIIDHRPIDVSNKWDPAEVQIKIDQVGSCCTLVANEIIQENRSILTKPLAYMLYQTIVYDTIALLPENGKATDLDVRIGNVLEKYYEFTEDRTQLFEKLWSAHNDIAHLSPKQLLYKDLKIVEGILVPGLPMLVENFLKLPGSFDAILEFCRENKVFCTVLVGLEAKDTVKRDVAIVSESKDDETRKKLLEEFKSNTEYDFQFEEVRIECDNVLLLRVHNTKLSRKQLVPLIKRAAVGNFVHNGK